MKALLIQLRVIDREQGLEVNTNDMAKIRSMLPQLHEEEKKKKGRGGSRQGSKFVKKKRRTSRGDERCAVKGSFEGNGYKYKE